MSEIPTRTSPRSGAYTVETMEATLRVRRQEPGGAHRYETYTVEVPVTATVLDALDVVKDQHDGTLAYRKSCRMAVCGSCGMRVDGGAVLGCKTSMKPYVDAGHTITGRPPMGNLPVIKDLVVDMEPFWRKVRAVKPYLDDARRATRASEDWRVRPEQHERSTRSRSASCAGAASPSATRWRPTPTSSDRRRSRRRYRFVGDVRDLDTRERLRDLNGAHGIWDCTRCYFCNQRCPKGVDPRDAIAKLGAEMFDQGITRDEGAKHARVFVDSTYRGGYLRETELVPKTIGPIAAMLEVPHALALARAGKVPNPLAPHKAKDNDEVQAALEAARARRRRTRPRERAVRAADAPQRGLNAVQDRYAYYPGCLASLSQKELDSSTRAIAQQLDVELIDMP